MNYLYMPLHDDPLIGELLDEEVGKLIFGRIPAHEWVKPERVTLQLPPVARAAKSADQGATLRDLIDASAGQYNVDDQPQLEFAIHPPWSSDSPSGPRIRPSERILNEFMSLVSAPDEKLRGFASRYGPLLIYCTVKREASRELIVGEYCEVWRYFSRSLQALLHIAAGFRAGNSQQRLKEDWDAIGDVPTRVRELDDRPEDSRKPWIIHPEQEWTARSCYFIGKGRDRSRTMWLGLLNCLLQLGQTRPWLLWEGSATESLPRLVFSGPNLLSYMALQVCLIAAKQGAFALCSFCQKQYTPKRTPKSGQKNYCPECRDAGVPVRMAQRARLARLRHRRA